MIWIEATIGLILLILGILAWMAFGLFGCPIIIPVIITILKFIWLIKLWRST